MENRLLQSIIPFKSKSNYPSSSFFKGNNAITSKVDSFLNNKGKIDGTWNDGDWVPWRYNLAFNQDNNRSTNQGFSIHTSDILKTNELIGKFHDNNVTFKLPIKLVNQITLQI